MKYLKYRLIPTLILAVLLGSWSFAQGTITGTITDLAGVPVENVRLTLTGDGPAQTTLTNVSGVYTFSNLPEGSDYTVTPADPENCIDPCITIADICLVSNWLDNAVPMTALQYIAADVNDSEMVTQADNGQILSFLVGNGPIPGSCYRFIPTGTPFPNPQNPWQQVFPEVGSANELVGTQTIDFHAVRRGDPSGCSTPAMAELGSLELGLTASVNETMNGDFFCVQVVAQNYTNLTGFSLTFNWQGNMTYDALSNLAPLQNFSTGNVIADIAGNNLSVFYQAPTPNGADLPSPSTLFEACFVTDGFDGENLDFELTGIPTVPGSAPTAAGAGCVDQLVTGFGGGGPIVLSIPVVGGGGGIPPSLMCPDNFTGTVTNEDCMGLVSLPALGIDPIDGDYSVTNDFNGSFDASGLYPVGITNVTYTVTDNVTLETAECSFTVTINDPEDCAGLCTEFNPEFTIGAFDEMIGSCPVDIRFIMSDVSGLASLRFTVTSGAFNFQSLPDGLSAEVESGNMEVTFVPSNGDTEISLGAYNDMFGSFDLFGFETDGPSPVITVTAFDPDGGVLCSEDFTYDCTPASARDCVDLGTDPGINLWQSSNIDRAQGGPGPLGNGDNYLRLRNDNGSANPWAFNVESYAGSFLDDLGECLCFSTYVRQQPGGVAQSYTPTVRLYRGNDVVTSDFYATFTAAQSIGVEDGWQRICMPLANCDGGLPANNDGSWTMTSGGDACLDWNALLGDFTGVAVLIEGSFPDINMGIDNFCFEECGISDASSCEATTTNISNDNCCPSLTYTNTGSDPVYGVSFTLLDGVTFDPATVTFPDGFTDPMVSTSNRTISQDNNEPFPETVEGLLDFCFLNVNAPEQRLVVNYFADPMGRTVLCSDTLTFNCPIQNYCLDVASDTLVCAEDGYRLQMNVVVPNNNYTDDVGRVKVIVPGLAEPIVYDFIPALTAGESFGIDTLLGVDPMAGDSLKLLVTAHDGPEERLCCFADSLCLEIPDCTSCDGATITFDLSEDECCWSYFITFPNSPPNIDSVWFFFQEFTGADFLLTELDNPGWEQITIIPGEEYAYIPVGVPDLTVPLRLLEICTTPGGDNVNALISYATFNRATRERLCNFTGGGLQEACPVMPCDSLAATLQSDPDNSCAYDLFLDNTYTTDPNLITSVTVNIISGPEPSFSGANLISTAPGWDFATGSGGSYTLNPTAGAMPLGTGQQVFRFNIDDSFSADSTYVEVAFLSGMDTLCRDTVVGICPGCITIPEEEILCDEDHHLYRFTFVNHSPYPVNAVRILETDSPSMDVLLNAQTHFLGVMVPVGGTYTGFLPVEFMDDGDGEFCFDIVLRQVVDGELPINCCFATYCVEVPDCPPTSPELCEGRASMPAPNNCPLEYLPVCGCDGITYTNICFAQDRGVLNYTQGACPTTPRPFPNFPIDDIQILDGTVIINTPVPFPIPDGQPNWYGYILQRLRTSDNTWWQVAATTVAEEDVIRLVDGDPAAGDQTYRILAVTVFGEPFLSETASVDVPARRAGISLSPNPATDVVWLQSEHRGAAEVEIISTTGQRSTVGSVTFSSAPIRLDLGQRGSGVHTIVVRFADGSWGSRRVVVE